jgi:hypothetical protein
MKTLRNLLYGAAGSLVVAAPAFATGSLTPPSIDLTDLYACVAVILTALAAIWIVTKVVAFFRSK